MTGGTRSLHRFQRAVSIALAILMLQGALDASHLVRDDDAVFGPRVVFHQSAVRHLDEPGRGHSASDPHCAICHWLQLLGTSQISKHVRAPQPPASLYHRYVARRRLRQAACARVPARGPPSRPVL